MTTDGDALRGAREHARTPLSLARLARLSPARGRTSIAAFMGQEIRAPLADAATAPEKQEATIATYRLQMRLLTEMQVGSVAAMARLFDGDYLAGNIFVALLAQSPRSQAQFASARRAGEGKPIAIRAIARSFRRPYETTRRAVHRLADRHLATVESAGVTLAAGATSHPDVAAFLERLHDLMVALLEDLFIFARMPPPAPADGDWSRDDIIQAALKLQLLSAEGLLGLFADWTDLTIIAAISTANIRKVTYDPELAFTYAAAHAIPPMTLRRPVTAKAICEAMVIDPVTCWRRIAKMKLLGLIEQQDDGLVIPGKWYNGTRFIANGCERIERMHIIIGRLASAGVPVNQPQTLYLQGRPALTAIGV